MNRPLFSIALIATTALLLLAPSVGADEGSLLERLSQETAAATARADAAAIKVRNGSTWVTGVLTGSPPRFVVPLPPPRNARQLDFHLADGTRHRAKFVGGDEALGISIYDLPEKLAAGRKSIAVRRTWGAGRGELALLAGQRPRLVVVGHTNRLRGTIDAGSPSGQDGDLLVSPTGELIGLRLARPAPAMPYNVSLWRSSIANAATKGGSVNKGGSWPGIIWLGQKSTLQAPFEPLLVYRSNDGGGSWGATPAGPSPGTFLAGPAIARVLVDVQTAGRVRHAYLGVVPTETRGQKGPAGVRLVAVLDGSPAAQAGLKKGDLVTGLDGQECRDLVTFNCALALRRPGDSITLRIEGRAEPVKVALTDRAEGARNLLTAAELGLTCVPLTPELRVFLTIPDEQLQGVAVSQVQAGSVAAQAGLQRGDIILRADGEPTRDVEELEAALAASKTQLRLEVRRGASLTAHVLNVRKRPSRKAR